jgi:hypothetical protein
MSDRERELLRRVMALDAALEKCLMELSLLYGSEAHVRLRTMRDELIRDFEESGIAPKREQDHSKIGRPGIEAIETAFKDFI